MKATIDGVVIAEADKSELASIEGNWYFPPQSLRSDAFVTSDTGYTCPWKGAAQYFSVQVNGNTYPDAAWSYPNLLPGAVERVGKDFAGFVAFARDVTVTD